CARVHLTTVTTYDYW
nr:immunoglobulin heavy chain junction region [Macaca mulatta]MOV52265.1 immunoglobulin heavy chain junction region [Macaca mulatta]